MTPFLRRFLFLSKTVDGTMFAQKKLKLIRLVLFIVFFILFDISLHLKTLYSLLKVLRVCQVIVFFLSLAGIGNPCPNQKHLLEIKVFS